MTKPNEFQQPQVTLRKLPYVLQDSAFPDEGVLDSGQVVWTRAADDEPRFPRTLGYVEGVGIVAVNSRALVRADLLKPEKPIAEPSDSPSARSIPLTTEGNESQSSHSLLDLHISAIGINTE